MKSMMLTLFCFLIMSQEFLKSQGMEKCSYSKDFERIITHSLKTIKDKNLNDTIYFCFPKLRYRELGNLSACQFHYNDKIIKVEGENYFFNNLNKIKEWYSFDYFIFSNNNIKYHFFKNQNGKRKIIRKVKVKREKHDSR